MSQEQLKAFIEKVQEDKGLQEKVAALSEGNIPEASEALSVIAQEAGFPVDKSDIEEMLDGVMSDEQLDQCAGGLRAGTGSTLAPDVSRLFGWIKL